MLRFYLSHITNYFIDYYSMPEDLTEFDPYVNTVKVIAESRNELDWLIVGLSCLIFNSGKDLTNYNVIQAAISDEDMHSIISYLYNKLCDDKHHEMTHIPVSFHDMTADEWNDYKAGLSGSPKDWFGKKIIK